MTNGEVIEALFPNVGTSFSNIIDLNLWWNAEYKDKRTIHCNCTDAEIVKSFIEDVRAVEHLLPMAEGEKRMTRKEAINRLQDAKDGYKEYLTDDAIDLAIKALEQDPILDKIRAEIEQLPTTKCTETHRIYIDGDDFKKNVLVILDKYKAESEEDE